jgi:UDP-glucuronate decarboxylase
LLDIAQTVKQLAKSKSRIVFKPLPIDDPKVRRPDITLAKAKLGWQAKVSLEQGLPLTIADFRKSL